MRYLIDGCYGDGNVGDECLLHAVIRLVRSADSEAKIAAFSSDPAATEQEAGVPAILQCNPFSRNLYGSLFKGLLRRTIDEIRRCDVFILGGGELFRDNVGLSATLGMFYRMRLAWLMGKRVLALGVGAQPATTWWGRRVLRQALGNAQSVVFRDPDSLEVARQIHPDVAGRWLPDLVFSLDWNRYIQARPSLRVPDARLRLGVAVKSLPRSHRVAEAVNHQLPGVLTAALAQFSRSHNCVVSVLPFASGDVAEAARLARRLQAAGVTVADVELPQIQPLQQHVAQLDFLLAVPLHASVFAFACGVPALGLAYDKKIPRLYQAFGMSSHCLPAANLAAGDVVQGLQAIVQQRRQLRHQLITKAHQAEQAVREAVGSLLTHRSARPAQSAGRDGLETRSAASESDRRGEPLLQSSLSMLF